MRPSDRSTSQDGFVRDVGDTIIEETNQSAKMDDKEVRSSHEVKSSQCLPVEEGEEAINVKGLPSPTPRSCQEMLEHNLTHWPFEELVQALCRGVGRGLGTPNYREY